MTVRVVPRASRNEVVGVIGDSIKLRVCAPPVDGKANDAVVEFLSERLDVQKARIRIRTGATGRRKHVCVDGITVETASRRLGV